MIENLPEKFKVVAQTILAADCADDADGPRLFSRQFRAIPRTRTIRVIRAKTGNKIAVSDVYYSGEKPRHASEQHREIIDIDVFSGGRYGQA
jgi:hypothetical protein